MDRDFVIHFQDRAVARLLDTTESFAAFLGIVMPRLAQALEVGSLRPAPTRWVGPLLIERHEDVVYEALLRGADPARPTQGPLATRIVLPVAHQGAADRQILFRLLRVQVAIWDRDLRRQTDERVPAAAQRLLPVIPILIHTGAEPWAPPALAALLPDHPALSDHRPTLPIELLDLAATSEERLIGCDHAVGWLLALLRAQYEDRAAFLATLTRVLAAVRRLAPNRERLLEHTRWCALLGISRRHREEWAMIEEVVSRAVGAKEAKTMVHTMADVWLQEGLEEGQRKLLLWLLRERLGAEADRYEARLRASPEPVLERAATAVVRYPTRGALLEALERLLPAAAGDGGAGAQGRG